jgi:hypothetical protein
MSETSADLGPPVDVACDAIRTALLFDDAREGEIARTSGLLLEKRTPPETVA